MKSCQLRLLLLCLSLTAAELPAQTAATDKFVQGSWVNIRQSEQAQSPVSHHLTTNTAVKLLRQHDKSCEISWQTPGQPGASNRGFIACHLLGDKALIWQNIATATLAGKTNPDYSPARAFWLTPAAHSLFKTGKHFQLSLLNAQQVQNENGGNPETNQSTTPVKLVRYKVPEFEAMKQQLSEGIVASSLHVPLRWSCQQVQKTMHSEIGEYSKLDERKIQDWLD